MTQPGTNASSVAIPWRPSVSRYCQPSWMSTCPCRFCTSCMQIPYRLDDDSASKHIFMPYLVISPRRNTLSITQHANLQVQCTAAVAAANYCLGPDLKTHSRHVCSESSIDNQLPIGCNNARCILARAWRIAAAICGQWWSQSYTGSAIYKTERTNLDDLHGSIPGLQQDAFDWKLLA